MVITKSISRFARNTLDCLNYIRKLKAKGIPIFFEKENILTTDSKGEILTTIMASIAQQESASISQNVQMGVRYHYAQGKVGAGHQRFLGYSRTEDASLRIVPEEANIVRRIFWEYLEGDSPGIIARRLTEEGLTWRYNKTGKWRGDSIKYILGNEKYAGNLLLQKYYTVDFLTKTVHRNRGEIPQFYVENSHPPIIPYEVFLQAQGEMMRRAAFFGNTFKKGSVPNMPSMISALSGRLYCCECGLTYRRKLEGKKHVWRCRSKIDPAMKGTVVCGNAGVKETVIHHAIVEAFNILPEERENLLTLRDQIERALIAPIDAQLSRMEEDDPDRAALLMQRTEYTQKRLQILSLLAWMGRTAPDRMYGDACVDYDEFVARTNRITRIGEITEANHGGLMTSFNDAEVIRYMEKAVVHPDRLEVVFKAGVTVEVALSTPQSK